MGFNLVDGSDVLSMSPDHLLLTAFPSEHCACEDCTEYFYYQDLEAEIEMTNEKLPKETPYDRPPAPNFFPHSGSPFVVDETPHNPFGPGGLGLGADAQAPQDEVNRPAHYQSRKGIETIDAIEAACEDLSGFEGYCTGNALKYLFRWQKKGGKKDLEKSRWYINRLLK